jgi:two-component system, sensor histidine kinase
VQAQKTDRQGTRPAPERRILVVEDNIDSARMLAVLFSNMGHKVEYAINGIVAIAVAHRFLPEFVFLDLKLPDAHGADVARQLRGNPKLAATRIYAVTGSEDEEDRRRALAAGCEAVLAKPVDTRVFEKLVAGG